MTVFEDRPAAARGPRKALLVALVLAALLGGGCDAEDEAKGPDRDPQVNDDPADRYSDAATPKGAIAIGTPVAAEFDASSHHLYDLSLADASVLTITLAGGDDDEFDTVVRVYGPRDAGGRLPSSPMAVDDDGGPGRSSLIEGLSLEAGAYAVVASTYGGRAAPGAPYLLEVVCAGGSCAGGELPPAPQECTPQPAAAWTVMIYGVYDASEPIPSLKGELARILSGHRADFASSSVNFVMLEDLKDAATAVYRLTPAGTTIVRPAEEIDTGDAGALRDFVRFAATCFPARRYALQLVGHSVSALDGGLVDYYPAGRSYMHWNEVRDAVREAIGRVGVLVLAACMTANVELAYEFRDAADYLAGYQSFSQGYEAVAWALAFTDGSDPTPEYLARRFARDSAAAGSAYEPQATAAFDLSRIGAVAAAVNDVAPLLAEALASSEATALADARRAAQSTVTSTPFTGMIDLVDWIDRTREATGDEALRTSLAGLRSAVTSAVTGSYVRYDTFGGSNPFDRAHGMSIGFPIPGQSVGRFSGTTLFEQLAWLSFYADTAWDETALAYQELPPRAGLRRIRIEVDRLSGEHVLAEAAARVNEALAPAGIELVFEEGEEIAPEEYGEPLAYGDYCNLYFEHFDHRGQAGWHQLVMATSLTGGINGWGRLGGDMFIISDNWLSGPAAYLADRQARIILHEFGHNLGLTHAGFDEAHPHDASTCAMASVGSTAVPVPRYCDSCLAHLRPDDVLPACR